MERAEREQRIDETLRKLRLIAGALALGVTAAIGVTYFLRGTTQDAPPPVPDPLAAWVLVTAGFALLISAPFVTRSLLARFLDPYPEEMEGRPVRKLEPAEHRDAVLSRFTLANLIAAVMREGAGMIGVLTVFLTAQNTAGYVLAAASVVMIFRNWPSRKLLESLLAPGR